MAKLRMALTISGAVSLGAYEAGVLAGLLCAIRPLCAGDDPAIRLDAIGGASAGSMAGLLAARCLTAGYDPVYVMEQVWVVQDSIKKMRAHNSQAPLSMEELRQLAADLLDLEGHDVAPYQSVAVRMVMTLTCLRGLDYAIEGGGTAGQAIDAVTYLDLSQATLDHGTSAADLLQPENASIVDVALASGADGVGSPPKLLDRSSLAGDYDDRGLALPVEAAVVHRRRDPRQRTTRSHPGPDRRHRWHRGRGRRIHPAPSVDSSEPGRGTVGRRLGRPRGAADLGRDPDPG